MHVHVPVVASIGYLRLGNTLTELDTTFLAPVDGSHDNNDEINLTTNYLSHSNDRGLVEVCGEQLNVDSC